MNAVCDPMLNASKKIGVLMLTDSFLPIIGGVETQLECLIKDLRKKQEYRIFVVTFLPPSLSKILRMEHLESAPKFERSSDLEIMRVPFTDFGLSAIVNRRRKYVCNLLLFLEMFLFASIFILPRREKIQIIHAHTHTTLLAARFLSLIYRKNIVMTLHVTYGFREVGKTTRLFSKILFSNTYMIAVSQFVANDLMALGLAKERISVVPHWVDLELFKPRGKRKSKTILGFKDMFVTLFVGRLVPEKGVKEFVDVAVLAADIKSIIFVVIGMGPLADYVKEVGKKVKNLRYIGWVPNDELGVYYSAADVMVYPSVTNEAFGRTIIEALACGTPVIGANRGAIPEIIDSSVGFIVQPIPSEIKEKILFLYNNSDFLRKLTESCREYAQEHFSEKNTEFHEEIYKSLVNPLPQRSCTY